MDEHNGYFRTVTTKGNSWDENEVSENNLFILDEGMKYSRLFNRSWQKTKESILQDLWVIKHIW